MKNPYRIEGPAIIQVSGGRTSGFMLRKILDAHDGKLPSDVIPCFQNTGKEHEATLIFIRKMQQEWNCEITWLEYRPNKHFVVVDYCSASRNGEPFEQLITERGYPPNPVTRYCTVELKIRTANRFVKQLGWQEHTRVIGLRWDETRRVARMKGDGTGELISMPMAEAKHTIDDVLEFWKRQTFDLELPSGDNAFGNCDCCFLKSSAKLEKIMTTSISAGEWWAKQEERLGKPFRIDRPNYRQMMTHLTIQGKLFDNRIDDETIPCMCHD